MARNKYSWNRVLIVPDYMYKKEKRENAAVSIQCINTYTDWETTAVSTMHSLHTHSLTQCKRYVNISTDPLGQTVTLKLHSKHWETHNQLISTERLIISWMHSVHYVKTLITIHTHTQEWKFLCRDQHGNRLQVQWNLWIATLWNEDILWNKDTSSGPKLLFLVLITLWNEDTSELGTLLSRPKGVLISQVSL
jgi:hypothetical protein